MAISNQYFIMGLLFIANHQIAKGNEDTLAAAAFIVFAVAAMVFAALKAGD